MATGSDPIPARGELEFIRRLRARLAGQLPPTSLPFGDDLAPLPGGHDLLWSTDMLMDGVDFDSRVHSWKAVGRKALAINLSDCAAMATLPVAALCAVALDNRLTLENALDLADGVIECGREHGCPLVGGDTNSWDHPTVISVTVAARPDSPHPPVRRDGARPGDLLVATGRFGGSILGRHLTFTPRLAESLALSRACRPHAMIDVSDGLARDLGHICTASGCGAEIDDSALDELIHPDARRQSARTEREPRLHALHDGEDFELLAAIDPQHAAQLDREPALAGWRRLGRFVSGGGLVLVGQNGTRVAVEPRGWEHFT